MLFLVLGWQLSLNSQVTTPPTHYVNQTLDIQTIATGILSSVTSGNLGSGTGAAASDLATLVEPLLNYAGPLPVPSFTTYILAHNALRAGISFTNSTQIQSQLDRLSQG
jgi:hypothetical protein